MKDPWNRCDECGRFIPLNDFTDGKATHKMLEPSSDLGVETWETLCTKHRKPAHHRLMIDRHSGQEVYVCDTCHLTDFECGCPLVE